MQSLELIVPGTNSAPIPIATTAIRLICCNFNIVIYCFLLYKRLESLSTFIYYYKKILVEHHSLIGLTIKRRYLTNVPIQILRDQDDSSQVAPVIITCRDKTVILAVLQVL